MAINSRSKGCKNERIAASVIKQWTKREFSRTPSSGGLQWKSSNSKGDIVSTEEGFYFPFCIEVKAHKDINFSELLMPNKKGIKILEFWEQCEGDAKKCGKIPMLMMRYNGLPREFFFIGLPTQFFEYCIEPFYSNHCKSITWGQLTIIPSNWLLDIPYKRVKGIFKNYVNNLEEKIEYYKGNRRYKISNRGYFIDTENGSILYGAPDSTGALCLHLEDNGKSHMVRVYREVAKQFVKNPKNKEQVGHIKPLRRISDARNLEWQTAGENGQHRWDNSLDGFVIQKIDPKTGKVLGEYLNCMLAAKSIDGGIGHAKQISRVLRKLKNRQTAYNFIWVKRFI
jgi:hypothetical protein